MAFECSYAGVGLLLNKQSVEGRLDLRAALEKIDSYALGWPSSDLANRSMGAQPRHRRDEIGVLYEPSGAGRWSIAKFIITQDIAEQIEQALPDEILDINGPGNNTGGQYALLRMQTDQGSIERPMRALQPKPLGGPGSNTNLRLLLLTLVDWRYDAVQLMGPTEIPYNTWDDFLSTLDGIEQVYPTDESALRTRIDDRADHSLRPAVKLSCGQRWPAVVEGAAVSLGLRYAQDTGFVDPTWARDRINDNLSQFKRYAGGFYPWGIIGAQPTNVDDDLAQVLPQSLKVSFPRFDGMGYTEFISDIRFTLSGFESDPGGSGSGFSIGTGSGNIGGMGPPLRWTATGILCSTATLTSGSASGSGSGNHDAVQAWLDARANDLIEWSKLAFLDVKIPGIVEYKPDGIHDVEYVYRDGDCYTRVYRGPFNEGVELVNVSECDEGSCGGEGGGGASGFVRPDCVLVFSQEVCCDTTVGFAKEVWYLVYTMSGNERWFVVREQARLDAIAQDYPVDSNGDPCFQGECPPVDNLSSGSA